MIIGRAWSNDFYSFLCAQEMDKMGIRIVSVFVRPGGWWEVRGQSDGPVDCDVLDHHIDNLIDNPKPQGGKREGAQPHETL